MGEGEEAEPAEDDRDLVRDLVRGLEESVRTASEHLSITPTKTFGRYPGTV